jgi:hypothetical protein
MDNAQQLEIVSSNGLENREQSVQANPRPTAPLSVIILSFNEETNLPACLDSLEGLNARYLFSTLSVPTRLHKSRKNVAYRFINMYSKIMPFSATGPN